jgi:hypothetical protein
VLDIRRLRVNCCFCSECVVLHALNSNTNHVQDGSSYCSHYDEMSSRMLRGKHVNECWLSLFLLTVLELLRIRACFDVTFIYLSIYIKM